MSELEFWALAMATVSILAGWFRANIVIVMFAGLVAGAIRAASVGEPAITIAVAVVFSLALYGIARGVRRLVLAK